MAAPQILQLRVRGGGGIYGSITFSKGDDPFDVAQAFGREHQLAAAAVVRLTKRIRAQAEQVFKLRDATTDAAAATTTNGGTEWDDSELDHGAAGAAGAAGADAAPTYLNMRIKGRDGVFGNIKFQAGDNPLEVAARFGREHRLPPDAVARLAVKIQSQVDALLALNGGGGGWDGPPPHPQADPHTASKADGPGSPPRPLVIAARNGDDDDDGGEREAEEVYRAARRRLASPEAAGSEHGSEMGEQAWADARAQRARALSPTASALMPGLEGAHGPATHHHHQQQQQPQQGRARSQSRSPTSAARTRKQQQLVCERLHAQARRMQDRKASLKQRVEKDKANEVLKTSFRAQSRSPSPRRASSRTRGQPRAGSRGRAAAAAAEGKTFHEALYYNDVKWRQTRAKALEAQAAERARQLAAEEARLHTFKPKLATSKQQQRAGKERRQAAGARSASPRGRTRRVDLFSYLHRTKIQSDAKLRERAHQIRAEEDAQNVFAPRINPLSERLSRRLRMERGGQLADMPSHATRRRLQGAGADRSPGHAETKSRSPPPRGSDGDAAARGRPLPQRAASTGRGRGRSAMDAGYRSGQRGHGRSLSEGPARSRSQSRSQSEGRGRPRERSPTSSSSAAGFTVFDALYASRLDHAAVLWQSRLMHLRGAARASPHRPNIGVNTFYPVEQDRTAFFQRLHEAGGQRDPLHLAARQQLKEQVEHEERGGRPPPVLTTAAEKELIHRLTVEAPKQHAEELQALQAEADAALRQVRSQGKDRRIGPRSTELAHAQQRRALSEVFDVLLATVLYTKNEERRLRGLQPSDYRAQAAASSSSSGRSGGGSRVTVGSGSVDVNLDDDDDDAAGGELAPEVLSTLADIEVEYRREEPPEGPFTLSPTARSGAALGAAAAHCDVHTSRGLLARARRSLSPADRARFPGSSKSDATSLSPTTRSRPQVQVQVQTGAPAASPMPPRSAKAALGSPALSVLSASPVKRAKTAEQQSPERRQQQQQEQQQVVRPSVGPGAVSDLKVEGSSSTRTVMKVTIDTRHAAAQRNVHVQTTHTFSHAAALVDLAGGPVDEDGLRVGGFVDLRRVQPGLLKPRAVAAAVAAALSAAQADRLQLMAEGVLPPDSPDAYMLGREEFVLRMETLIEQGAVQPVRDALVDIEKGTSWAAPGVDIPASDERHCVLAPALHKDVYHELLRHTSAFKSPQRLDEEAAARDREQREQARLKSEELLKERCGRFPEFQRRASGDLPLEDYLIQSRERSESLRSALREQWDAETFRECSFQPFQAPSSSPPPPPPRPRPHFQDSIPGASWPLRPPSSSSGAGGGGGGGAATAAAADGASRPPAAVFSQETVSTASKRRHSSAARSYLSPAATSPFAAAFNFTSRVSGDAMVDWQRQGAKPATARQGQQPPPRAAVPAFASPSQLRNNRSMSPQSRSPTRVRVIRRVSKRDASRLLVETLQQGGDVAAAARSSSGPGAGTRTSNSTGTSGRLPAEASFGDTKKSFVYADAAEVVDKQRERFAIENFKIAKGYYN